MPRLDDAHALSLGPAGMIQVRFRVVGDGRGTWRRVGDEGGGGVGVLSVRKWCVRVRVRACVRACARVRVRACVRVGARVGACVFLCVFVCMYLSVFTCKCMCVCT